MSHHGMNEEEANRLAQMAEQLKLGATGEFPKGRLNSSDEGELKLDVTHDRGKVIVHFGKPILWIGFTKEEAAVLADLIMKHAHELNRASHKSE